MWSLRRSLQNFNRIIAAGLAIGLFVIPAVAAAQAVSQAYGVTGTVQKGMIVMLDPKNASNVQALTNKKDSAMQGVVVAASDSAVSLSNDSTTDQVYVATTGKYDALVSNQNGAIKAGDIISISALDGIGMKADGGQSIILGKALENFDGTSNISGTTSLTDSNGGKATVSIGLIEVNIGISHNPLAATKGADAAVPGFLRKLAQAIAGKPVSAARIYISVAVLLVTIIVGGSLLYGGVRSSLTAIGRNPLARKSVLRGLFQVTFIGIIIFVIGLFAIYLLLKL
jgi:hypothetical protein